MQATSIIEIYTLVLGWHIHNGIWSLLEQSGLFLIPFIVIVIRNLLKAREEKDKTDVGVLAFRLSEVQLYVAFFTVLLLVKPTINLHVDAVDYTERLCTSNMDTYRDMADYRRDRIKRRWGDTHSTFDTQSKYIDASLDGKPVRIPLLWYPLEFYLRGFTEAAKHTLPCKPDLRTVSGALTTAQILNQRLRHEAQQFYRDCWLRSANRYLRDQPVVDAERYPDIDEDISWFGSRFFLEHPDYYRTYDAKEGLRSMPYDDHRDKDKVAKAYADGLGFPNCNVWWASSENGLRKRLLNHLNRHYIGADGESAVDRLMALGARMGAAFGITAAEDALLKRVLRTDRRIRSVGLAGNYTREQAGGVFNQATAWVSKTAMGWGMFTKNIGHDVEMHTYQFAAPVVQALILLLITLSLPILSVIALYRLEVIFSLLMLKFSVIFWSFLFQLAFWLDNYLLEGLMDYSDADGFLLSLGGVVDDYDPTVNLVNYIARMMYIALPLAFSVLMSIAGYRGGDAFSSAIENQGRTPGNLAKAEGGKLQDMAINVATKGKVGMMKGKK